MATPLVREEPRLDLIVAGHTNIDRILRVEELPAPDRTVPLVGQRTILGGTAATLARIASRSGVRTGLVSRVGLDFPEAFVAELRRDAIDLSGLERVPDSISPTCYIIEDAHGHQVTFIHQGPMDSAEDAFVPEELLASGQWLHLTTGPPTWQLKLKEAARARGLRVAVDPAQEIHYRWPACQLRELLRGSEMLFGNELEVRDILRLLKLKRPEELLPTVPVVIMTRGAKGVVAYTRAETLRVPVPELRGPVQVTGAGDSFRGGFYAAFFEGRALRDAIVEGTRVAQSWMRQATEARSPRGASRSRPRPGSP